MNIGLKRTTSSISLQPCTPYCHRQSSTNVWIVDLCIYMSQETCVESREYPPEWSGVECVYIFVKILIVVGHHIFMNCDGIRDTCSANIDLDKYLSQLSHSEHPWMTVIHLHREMVALACHIHHTQHEKLPSIRCVVVLFSCCVAMHRHLSFVQMSWCVHKLRHWHCILPRALGINSNLQQSFV